MTLPSNGDNLGSQQESFPELLVSFVVSPAGFIAMGVGCVAAAAMYEEHTRHGTSGAACGFAVAAGLCAVAAAIVRVGRRV